LKKPVPNSADTGKVAGWQDPRQGDFAKPDCEKNSERPAARQPNIVPAGRGRKASLLAHRHDSISAGMTLPRIQPIAPTWRKTPFDDPDWLFDLKYDGFRGLGYLDRGRNRLISRNNTVMTRFEALADQIASLLDVHDAILDGEVIAADETGRPMFCDLLRRARAAAYVAFDIIWLNGTDLRSLPLHERRRQLQTVLPKASPIVSAPVSVTGRGCELFDLMCANDLEGIVAKRLADRYDPRVRWLKIKNLGYSQAEGRGDLFNRAPRPMQSAGWR
jgi:ATP-dependent DNA ligase